MSVKCSMCAKKVETTFLDKIIGTYVNGEPVCRDCQIKTKSRQSKRK
jgi:hypothetical protein